MPRKRKADRKRVSAKRAKHASKSNKKPLFLFKVTDREIKKFPRFVSNLTASNDSKWVEARTTIRREVTPVGPKGQRPKSKTLMQLMKKTFPSLAGCTTDRACFDSLMESWLASFDNIADGSLSEPYTETNKQPDNEVKKIVKVFNDTKLLFNDVMYDYPNSFSSRSGSVGRIHTALDVLFYAPAERKAWHKFSPYYPILVSKAVVRQQHKEKRQQLLATRLKNLVYVDEPRVIDVAHLWGKIIFKADGSINKDKDLDNYRACWIQLMTGCRSTEIHFVSTFVKYADLDLSDEARKSTFLFPTHVDLLYIRQQGVAKDRAKDESVRFIDKPVLKIPKDLSNHTEIYSAADVVGQWAQLRKNRQFEQLAKANLEEYTRARNFKTIQNVRSDITRKFNSVSIKIIRDPKYFGPLLDVYVKARPNSNQIGTHILRKIFLNYSFQLYGRASGRDVYDRTLFISMLGGWKDESSLMTASSYTDIRIRTLRDFDHSSNDPEHEESREVLCAGLLRARDIQEHASRIDKLETLLAVQNAPKLPPKNIIGDAIASGQESVILNGVEVPLVYNSRDLSKEERFDSIKKTRDLLSKALPGQHISATLVAKTGFGKKTVLTALSHLRQ